MSDYHRKYTFIKFAWSAAIFSLVNAGTSSSFAQTDYNLSRDQQNRITTTIRSGSRVLVLEGSPFYSDPPWQSGSIKAEPSRQAMTGEIAFDLVANLVSFRSSTHPQQEVTPYEFELNGVHFVSQTKHFIGGVKRRYYELLYKGKIKFLRHVSRKVTLFAVRSSNSPYDGYYRQKDDYFISRGDLELTPVTLTKSSLSRVLDYSFNSELEPTPVDELTVDKVVDYLKSNHL